VEITTEGGEQVFSVKGEEKRERELPPQPDDLSGDEE